MATSSATKLPTFALLFSFIGNLRSSSVTQTRILALSFFAKTPSTLCRSGSSNRVSNVPASTVIFSLLVIFLYILIRFKNWQFGLGAILALIHDVLLILGLFSLLYSIMPFSMEIDQAFIAAILTVVGYSINDTVVVFDRVREYLGLYKKRERTEIINTALNSTLSRTFSTSLSTFVVLLTMFILGGETIRGFIFALMIGVIVGTYSSLFIAAPIVYDTVKTAETTRVLKGRRKS